MKLYKKSEGPAFCSVACLASNPSKGSISTKTSITLPMNPLQPFPQVQKIAFDFCRCSGYNPYQVVLINCKLSICFTFFHLRVFHEG